MTKIAIDNVVICEDVRHELRGKFTIVGVSVPELNVVSFPANLRVALWVSGTPSELGEFDIAVRAINPDGKTIVEGGLKGEIKSLSKMSIVIGPMHLAAEKEGDYKFQWQFQGKKWSAIETLHLKHGRIED